MSVLLSDIIISYQKNKYIAKGLEDEKHTYYGCRLRTW